MDKGLFLPGMSVTAEVETRYRTNVVTVPIQSVTTRFPKGSEQPMEKTKGDAAKDKDQVEFLAGKKVRDGSKPVEVVFLKTRDTAKMVVVKRGISDDAFYEIIEGLTEGEEVITGSFKAISKELEDEKPVVLEDKKKEPAKS